uniref:DUF2961 domain-containing protein n=1 Tax=Acidobacterium capsulatum TaxID=33075 RepID=A0A7V4XUK8_9BACT
MDRRRFSLSMAGFSLASAALARAEAPSNELSTTSSMEAVRTFTQVGKQEKPFVTNAEAVIAEKTGCGYLDHMWFGGGFPDFLRLRLRIYVDGEALSSIDMELGMGIGVGFGDSDAPWGTIFNGITGSPSGVFLNYRVPYRKSIRVTAELPPGVARDTVFWWIVRGIEGLPLQISGLNFPENTRLRLHKRVDLTVHPLQEFTLCDVAGSGMVFMVSMAAQSTNFEFMEGQMRAYIDGSSTPQFLSSGLEDYFLGTYYFNRGLYHFHQAGLTHKNEEDHSFSAYRFHDLDPVLFSGGLRLACRCGEKRGDLIFGTTGQPQTTTYATYVWTYEW